MAKVKRNSVKENKVYRETKIPEMLFQHEIEMSKKALRLLRQNDNYIFSCKRRKRCKQEDEC